MRRGLKGWRVGWLATSSVMLALGVSAVSSIQAYHKHESAGHPEKREWLATDFAAPKRFAIVLRKPENRRTVHKRGGTLVHVQDGTRAMTFERVEANEIVIRESPTGTRFTLKPGDRIPGWTSYAFLGTVMLERLEYHLKPVEHLRHEEPLVLEIAGGRAVLELEVQAGPERGTGSAAGQRSGLEARRAEQPARPVGPARLPVQEVEEDVYEVAEAAARPVIEKAGQALSDIRPKFTPMYRSATTPALTWSSQLGSVALSDQGFTVARPGLARTIGIEAGDRVLSLNGRHVNSPLNAYWTFQELFVRDRNLTELQLNLLRQGAVVTKTFRIR